MWTCYILWWTRTRSRLLNYQVQELVGNFSAAEHLLASEGGLCIMELVFL